MLFFYAIIKFLLMTQREPQCISFALRLTLMVKRFSCLCVSALLRCRPVRLQPHHGNGLSQRCRKVELLARQLASGTGTELHGFDVLRHVEFLFRLRSANVAYAAREDGEVVNLHVLAVENHLLDARHHGCHHTQTLRLGESGVVLRHVLCQLAQVNGLLDYWKGIPFVEGCRVLVLVLFHYKFNHIPKCFFKVLVKHSGTTALLAVPLWLRACRGTDGGQSHPPCFGRHCKGRASLHAA